MPRKRDVFTLAARLLRPQPKIDWQDPDAVREYLRDAKRAARDAKLPENRTCTVCGLVKERPRQWEVLSRFKLGASEEAVKLREAYPDTGRDVPVCKSCAMTYFPGARG